MKQFLAILALLAVLAPAAPALADNKTPHPHHPKGASINHRQDYQQHRIHEGVKSGELTKREAHRLRTQEAMLNRKEAFYRKDGELSKRERIDLKTDQNQLSRRIYKQKHDGQDRPN